MILHLDDLVLPIEQSPFGDQPEREPVSPATVRRGPRILVAEDDAEMRRLMVDTLRRAGFEVQEAHDGWRTIDAIAIGLITHRHVDFDLVISDLRMPGVDGLTIIAGLQSHSGGPASILITAFGSDQTRAEALRRGASEVLEKPFSMEDLVAAVRSTLARRRAQIDESDARRSEDDSLSGDS